MHYTKFIINAVILSATMLVACSENNPKFDQLSSEVHTMNIKINKMNQDMNAMRSDINSAKNDAMRANKRLDNQENPSHKK